MVQVWVVIFALKFDFHLKTLVLRPFCLVKSHTQDTATNAGELYFTSCIFCTIIISCSLTERENIPHLKCLVPSWTCHVIAIVLCTQLDCAIKSIQLPTMFLILDPIITGALRLIVRTYAYLHLHVR